MIDPGSLSGHTNAPEPEPVPEPGKRARRRGRTAAFVAGLVALTAITAGAVVAIGSSDSPSNPPSGARDKPAAGASGSAPAEPGGTSTTAPPETTPSSTFTGTVDGGIHEGDLRHFLLPVPNGAETYGDEAGDVLTFDDVAVGYEDRARTSLRAHGFRDAVHRAYRTADGNWEVDVELVQLGSPSAARAFAEEYAYEGPRVAIPGDSRARASRLDSAAAESSDAFIAVSYEGDVHITVTLTGATRATPDRMAELLDRQYTRLRTGR